MRCVAAEFADERRVFVVAVPDFEVVKAAVGTPLDVKVEELDGDVGAKGLGDEVLALPVTWIRIREVRRGYDSARRRENAPAC